MNALATKTPEEFREALKGAAIIANQAGIIIRSQAREIEQLRSALDEVREYFDQRVDISAKNENAPNEEMRLLSVIDAALSRGGRDG